MVQSLNLFRAGFALAGLAGSASAHIALWHPSMWGFNVTAQTFPYDNRPVIPLMNMPFQQWWWHNFLNYPPNAGDFFELPAGGTATAQTACDKGATDYYASSQGGDIRQGNWPCPNQPSTQFHANNENDVAGCALAITYKSDEHSVQPEDFTVFSTQPKCVWTRYTDFEVPAAMPACPPEGCICSWFWIHRPDSGAEQNYMTPFRCKVTGATQTAPIMKAQLPRRCGADPANGRPNATPSNCTVGAKQPFYWYQTERNNMFEGQYSPPLYNRLYGYEGGAENDIFEDSGSAPAKATSSPVAAATTHQATTNVAAATHQPTTSAAAATQQATTNVAVVEHKTTSTSSTATVAHTSPDAAAHTSVETEAATPTPVSWSVTTAHTSSSVAAAHTSSPAAAAHTSSAETEARTSPTVSPAHSSAASSSSSVSFTTLKVPITTATASSASATSTSRRRCKSRKVKRSAFAALEAEKEQDAKRTVSPHARHHNVGRLIHDSTLH